MIPEHLSPFFWDINTDNFDPLLYPHYTIARLLEYGNPEASSWMKKTFSHEIIEEAIRTERALSPRSANFWALFIISCENRCIEYLAKRGLIMTRQALHKDVIPETALSVFEACAKPE
jgi:hypothetical protein